MYVQKSAAMFLSILEFLFAVSPETRGRRGVLTVVATRGTQPDKLGLYSKLANAYVPRIVPQTRCYLTESRTNIKAQRRQDFSTTNSY